MPTANGAGAAVIAVPNTVAVSADGYARGTLTLTGAGQQEAADDEEDDEEEEEETLTASEPDSIEITGPSARSGTVNEELEAALIVRVLDDDGDGLEDARVFYRVIEGRGRISDGSRGGRRIGVVTDDDGYARVNFTPTDGGTHTIRVNTDDLSTTVEFTITTGSASLRIWREGCRHGQYARHRRYTRPECKSGCACRCGESSADVMGRRWCDLRTCGRESPKIRTEC